MPAGRPSSIDHPVRVPDGQGGHKNIPAGQRILDALKTGCYLDQAAAVAGVGKSTVYGWIQTGTKLITRAVLAEQYGEDPPELTANEQRMVDFAEAIQRVEAEWEVLALGTLEQLGRGGIEQVKTVVKVANVEGTEVELDRTTTTTRTLPDAAVLRWRLERRFPERYGPTVEVFDGGASDPSTRRAADLAGMLRQERERREAAAIDTTAEEAPAAGDHEDTLA